MQRLLWFASSMHPQPTFDQSSCATSLQVKSMCGAAASWHEDLACFSCCTGLARQLLPDLVGICSEAVDDALQALQGSAWHSPCTAWQRGSWSPSWPAVICQGGIQISRTISRQKVIKVCRLCSHPPSLLTGKQCSNSANRARSARRMQADLVCS